LKVETEMDWLREWGARFCVKCLLHWQGRARSFGQTSKLDL
jgi:hypothetical protein